MFKGIRGLFILTVLVLALSVQVRADMTDKATLGGQSTTNGVYDWRVTSTGDLVPGTTSQNNIGGASNNKAIPNILLNILFSFFPGNPG